LLSFYFLYHSIAKTFSIEENSNKNSFKIFFFGLGAFFSEKFDCKKYPFKISIAKKLFGSES
jgi:hypothetical protein